jgi:hypothetical protein
MKAYNEKWRLNHALDDYSLASLAAIVIVLVALGSPLTALNGISKCAMDPSCEHGAPVDVDDCAMREEQSNRLMAFYSII